MSCTTTKMERKKRLGIYLLTWLRPESPMAFPGYVPNPQPLDDWKILKLWFRPRFELFCRHRCKTSKWWLWRSPKWVLPGEILTYLSIAWSFCMFRSDFQNRKVGSLSTFQTWWHRGTTSHKRQCTWKSLKTLLTTNLMMNIYVITNSDTALRVVINTEENMYFHEKRNHLHSSRRIDCVLQTFV